VGSLKIAVHLRGAHNRNGCGGGRRGTPVRSAAMADGYDVQGDRASLAAAVGATRGTYEIENDDPRPPFYVLCMYPYPSGAAHQGHVRKLHVRRT